MRAQENHELQEIVRAYKEFRLCREIHLDPDELDNKDAEKVERWMMYIDAETEAEKWLRKHPPKEV